MRTGYVTRLNILLHMFYHIDAICKITPFAWINGVIFILVS